MSTDYQALLQKAIAAKETGNAAFAAQDYKKASMNYKLVYMIIGAHGSHAAEHKRILDRTTGGGGGAGDNDFATKLAGKKKDEPDDEVRSSINNIIATTYANLAMTLINLKRLPQALDACEIALLYSPENAKVHYRRGLVFLTMGRTDEAKEAFERVLQLVPDDVAARQRLDEVLAAERRMLDQQKAAMKKMFE
jgi:tetratricopeptide (TPR) repeat protein